MFSKTNTVPAPEVSHHLWIASMSSGWVYSSLLQAAHTVLDQCMRMEKRRRQGSIFEITSTLHTGPRGSGAYVTQPSCDLHTSAAAWLWLSPVQLLYSHRRGLTLPRLPLSHAFVQFFSRLFPSHNGRSKQFYFLWFKLRGKYTCVPPVSLRNRISYQINSFLCPIPILSFSQVHFN